MPVKFTEMLDAFEFVGVNSGEHEAYVCTQTGKIYWHVESLGLDDPDNELPDDIEEGTKYVAIPDKRTLGLGKSLALDFAREFLPNDLDQVEFIFSKRGAYQKFKDLLERRKALERWYDFEVKATEQAVRKWCEENSIELVE